MACKIALLLRTVLELRFLKTSINNSLTNRILKIFLDFIFFFFAKYTCTKTLIKLNIMRLLLFYITLAFSLGIVTLLILPSSSQAQCVACFQSADGSCSTDIVNRSAHETCGCDGGCDCEGQCTVVGSAMNLQELLQDNIEIPVEGILVTLEMDNSNELLSEFSQKGYVGENEVNNVFFGENLALYRLDKNEFIAFPVRENKMDLHSCDGEYLATIRENY